MARIGAMVVASFGMVVSMGGAARADQTCVGTLSGNLISPLPKQPAILLHVSDASAANVALAERFKNGMRAAGVTLSDTGGVTMELATSILGGASATSGTGTVSPEFGLTGTLAKSAEDAVLTMSISLMDTTLAQIDWVGYVNCKIRTTDLGQMAQDLGYAVGKSIGQTFPPRKL